MRLELTGRHVEVTPSLRRLVDAKLARLERLLNDSALSAQVVLTRERVETRADVTLHARGEKFLHAAGKGASWQGAMAQAVARLVQQAQTVKGKWQERKRRRSKGAAASGEPAAAIVRPQPVRLRMPRILRASRQTIKAMSVSDAARQLDGDGGIVVFRDAETSAIAILYRGNGGELTLVETEP
jgi:ribosomal subunit interface protein